MQTLSPATIAATQQTNERNLSDLRAQFDAIATIDVARLDWRAMMESGAIVTLKVSRYRGVMALSAQDMGLDATELNAVKEILSLGHRLLLPASVLGEFNSIETRARQIVRLHSLLTPFGLFVTPSAWAKLSQSIAPFKIKFDDAVGALLSNLEGHYDRMRAEYYTLAGQVRSRLESSGSYCGWNFDTEFVDRCMLDFPTPDKLRAAFSFDLSMSFVPLSYTTPDAAPTYADSTDDLLSLRRAVLEEQNATRQSLVNDFLSGVQSEIFTLINDSMSDVLAAIDNNGSGAIAGRSSVQLRRLVERLNDLNFWSDPRVELMQSKITELLDRPANQRDQSLTRATIDEIQLRARQAIITIERQSPIAVSSPAPTVNLSGSTARASAPNLSGSTSTRASIAAPTNRPNRPF